MSALERVALSLDRNMPTIELRGYREPVTGMTFYADEVKVHTPQGTYVPYAQLVPALATILDVRSL